MLIAASYKLQIPNWAGATADAMRLPLRAVRFVPAVEFFVAGMCFVGFRYAGLVATAVLLAYTAILVPRIGGPPCACFGRRATPITRWTIFRNIGLIGVALVSVLA